MENNHVGERLGLFEDGLCTLLSALARLALEGGEMGEGWSDAVDPGVIASVLTDTAFGHVWMARLATGLALAMLIAFAPKQRMAAAVFSGLFLASLGLVDHASMRNGAIGS